MTERQPNVLVVEDDAALLQSTVSCLRDVGFMVDSASNGAQALARLATRKFDVVVSDMRMPALDGVELLHIINEAYPWLPVIMITGYTEAAEVEELYGRAYSYFAKPFDIEELIACVRRAFDESCRTIPPESMIP